MNPIRIVGATLVAFALAAFALAQNADKNTAGPTRNDYRLRIIQPLEGASITGTKVQVVVDTEIPGETDTRQDVNSMPRPIVDVFLDERFQGALKGGDNVIELTHVTFGPHTVVLLAKNLSGEIIDRRTINIVTVAPPPKPVEHPVVAPPPAPAPAPVPPAYVPPPPPAPVAEPLPKTGTADPLFAVAGVVLVAAGFALRRLV